jgi:hypothetical protein
MKSHSLLRPVVFLLAAFFPALIFAQAPEVKFSKALGGSIYERAYDLQPLSKGQYIVAAHSSSDDGQVTGWRGANDAWVVIVDSTGKIKRKKNMGGGADDFARGIALKGDGTFAVCGTTYSTEAVPLHFGASDIYFFTLSSVLGAIDSTHFGGTWYDEGVDLVKTPDSAFAVLGHTSSVNFDATGNHGMEGTYDLILIKLPFGSGAGFVKLIGGTLNEFARKIILCSDGGYLVVANTNSSDGDVSGFHGGASDGFVAKISAAGILEWTKCLGGTGQDDLSSAVQTSDGGFLLAGGTNSMDGDAAGNPDPTLGSVWVVKLDAAGEIEWSEFYGGEGEEGALALTAMSDGTFTVAAYTTSSDGDLLGHWYSDFCCFTTDGWIFNINSTGSILWQGNYGGGGSDYPTDVLQNSAGNLVIAGFTSSATGQVSGFHGNEDAWITRLGSVVCATPVKLKTTSVFSTLVTFNWDLVPGAMHYKFRVRPTGGSWTNYETDDGSPGDGISDLAASTSYELQIRAVCKTSPLEQSPWSKKLFFSTTARLNSLLTEPGAVVTVYPNPATNFVTIEWGERNFRCAEVYDPAGRMMHRIPLGREQEKLNLNIAGLPPGIYLLQLPGENENWKGKFIKE